MAPSTRTARQPNTPEGLLAAILANMFDGVTIPRQSTPEQANDLFQAFFAERSNLSPDHQTLLEAIERARTPSLTPSTGRGSRRNSSRAPTYDPQNPAAAETPVLYDPANWEAASRRPGTPIILNRRSGGRSSPGTPTIANTPRTRSRRPSAQEYDPRTPLFHSPLQYPSNTPIVNFWDTVMGHQAQTRPESVAPGGERSAASDFGFDFQFETDHENENSDDDDDDDDESAQDNTITQQIDNSVDGALRLAIPKIQNELEKWITERLRGLASAALELKASKSKSAAASPLLSKPASRRTSSSASAAKSSSEHSPLKRVTFDTEDDDDDNEAAEPDRIERPPLKRAKRAAKQPTTSTPFPSPSTPTSQFSPAPRKSVKTPAFAAAPARKPAAAAARKRNALESARAKSTVDRTGSPRRSTRVKARRGSK
ncbi:hypothetical protein Q7P37_007574 [Cladosporium fusiforme]